MTPDGQTLLGEGEIVFHSPTAHPTVEGPKFLKKDDWYYILAPAGGVATGWQLALRSRNIYGPYEPRVVLEQGLSPVNGPHQGALVDLPNGEWWFVHFQDAGVYGRVVHLQPVTWKDGWPLIGHDQDGNGIGEPVLQCHRPRVHTRSLVAIPATSDEFDAPGLGLQWQWQANHQGSWYSLERRKGWLRLFATRSIEGNLLESPSLLMQKFPARAFEIESAIDVSELRAGDEAGLVILGRTWAALAVRGTDTGSTILFRENGADHALGRVEARTVIVRVRVKDGGDCHFEFLNGDTLIAAPRPFQATAGHWLGARAGIYCIGQSAEPRGHADFDYFRFG
jgi:beta-xylosidase